MATVSLSPVFKATWSAHNLDLQEKERTLSQKIARIVWNIFSFLLLPIAIARAVGWAVHFIAKKITLPSAWGVPYGIIKESALKFKSFSQRIENDYQINKQFIETPDGIKLTTVHFKHKQSDKSTPTIILFCSNYSHILSLEYGWLIEKAIERGSPCNFVAFNYRGTLYSKRQMNSPDNLKIDGDTVYQFVNQHLKVPEDKIHCYGWSLGGAVATNVKALHPESKGPLCNIRSFESIRSVAKQRIPHWLRPLLFWIPWAMHKQSWNLIVPFEKIKCPTMIVYHREDAVTPYEASAYKGAIKAKLKFEEVELFQTPELIQETNPDEDLIDHHTQELHKYLAKPTQRKADEVIADFILPPSHKSMPS